MADTNNVDIETNNDSNEDNSDSEEDSVDEEMLQFLDESTFQRLKQHDPAITNVCILLNCDVSGKCYFNSIDWEENGYVISDNIHLKRLSIEYKGVPFQRTYDQKYILGEEGHNLPTRQQLQAFFKCINRNSSIKELLINYMEIDEFGIGLIEGLVGHRSLTKLEMSNGALGSKGCTEIGKVLKHPTSKLKDLRLKYNKLDDDRLGIICNALLGNSTIKRFCLNGNLKIAITSSGWRQLSTVLQHPNCKLIDLDLRNAEIDIEGANVLGDALSGSSVKALDLSFNRNISTTAWRTLLSQLAHTSIEKLNLSSNSIDDDGLAALANIRDSIKSINLSQNKLIGDPGWQSFFNSLQTRGSQLKKLVLSHNHIGNEGIVALGSLLSASSIMETLHMHSISLQYGWHTLFRELWSSNLDLIDLNLGYNSIDEEDIQLLVPLVLRMTSLKVLRLFANRSVSFAGWQALSGILQSPTCVLRELDLDGNNINDDSIVAFASALAQNNTLKQLFLGECYDEDGSSSITTRGWAAVSLLLCNNSSIMDTYNSNHTLENLTYDYDNASYCPDDLVSLVILNRNKDKVEVARQKILQTHFSDDDTSNNQEFLDMDLEVMPAAISWIGRPTRVDWNGTNVSGLSLLYNLVRKMPDLIDTSAQKKQATAKSKSKADTSK